MTNHPDRDKVIASFKDQWQGARPESAERAVSFLTDLYDRFRAAELADRHFEKQLISNPNAYKQRVAELLLAEMLWNDGFELDSAPEGPDFKATKNDKSAWIELITPEPSNVLLEFHSPKNDMLLRCFPHEEINLRWTSAISEKSKKLLGDNLDRKNGYIAKGIVDPDDSFVLAVNARLLAHNPLDGLYGISQYPAPIEVLFGVGPTELAFSLETGELENQRHQHRPYLFKKKSGSEVQSDIFLDDRYAPISAVLGLSLCESKPLGNEHYSELVHNPLAANPIPSNWLTAQRQWKCEIGANQYTVRF